MLVVVELFDARKLTNLILPVQVTRCQSRMIVDEPLRLLGSIRYEDTAGLGDFRKRVGYAESAMQQDCGAD